jgi:lipopolysaccharide/colanic/teichoic acid biosynthesis glycosyltransferase/glycosyltransferase involved in cell wall biosynthesis
MKKASVIIPAYNAERTIGRCIESILCQTVSQKQYEVIVVDDGSSDQTINVARQYDVKVLTQKNGGAAAARNHGVQKAKGEFLLFTDADCEVSENWIAEMLKPFGEDHFAGVKGAYRTKQRELMARFTQLEYENRYRYMKKHRYIDFIDTYSAAYRKDVFSKNGGFDCSYTTASGEDSEFSYKLQERGFRLVFNPDAIVYHQHPDTLWKYLKKKFRNAYWRALTWKKHPSKIVRDSHTPNVLKWQTILAGLSLVLAVGGLLIHEGLFLGALLMLGLLFLSAFPFVREVAGQDIPVGIVSPLIVVLRSFTYAIGAGLKIVGLSRDLVWPHALAERQQQERDQGRSTAYETSRRILLDILLAGVLLLISSPLILLCGLLTRLTSPGPMIYRRKVLGLGGCTFDAYKIRTMRDGADRYLEQNHQLRKEYERNFKLTSDPRVTPVGRVLRKLSMDELPQLINVIKGEMSLVGPRMISPAEIEKYGSNGSKLVSVRPGLTGWWQVQKRQTGSYDKRVALDQYYLDHRSLMLDLKIILLTIPAVLSMRGAH